MDMINLLKCFSKENGRGYTTINTPKMVILVLCFGCGQCGDKYVTPLSTGMKASLSYDIANLFYRPPAQGGIISVALSISLMMIIFFGVIVSPFGYFFGIPSKKYVLDVVKENNTQFHLPEELHNGGTYNANYITIGPRNLHHPEESYFEKLASRENFREFRRFTNNKTEKTLAYIRKKLLSWIRKSPKLLLPFSDASQMFKFLAYRSSACDKVAACFAHSGLMRLPKIWKLIYRLFSRNMLNIPKDLQVAIITGIQSNENCSIYYKECNESLFSITVKSFLNLMSISQSQKLPKRKQSMYY